jgi:glycosyltransferase involved in cell wall biosynthesis
MLLSEGLVSVIVPTYNRAQLCKKTVESALRQTFHNMEVIVVDDGSTDDTEPVISGLDPRVVYIKQENQGVSAARNHGLRCARGEYIAFLDSDDIWLPWKLECQLDVLRRFPSAGMVWSDMSAVDEKGNVLFESFLKKMYSAYSHFDHDKHFKSQDTLEHIWKKCPSELKSKKCYAGYIFDWMFLGNLVHTSTVLLRRERQREVGYFDTDLVKSGEDYDFHLRTCQLGDVAYIDVSSIQYRIGASDQLTARKNIVWMARNDLKTITAILRKKNKLSLPAALIQQRFAESHAWIGMEEYFEDRASARRHLLMSLRYQLTQKRIILLYLLSFLPYSILTFLKRMKGYLKKIKN